MLPDRKQTFTPRTNECSAGFFLLSLIMGLIGVFLLYRINFLSGFFGTLSIILYVFAYTPLKRVSPISVFVGAFPGAIPFMLGWVAVTNDFDIEPGILFCNTVYLAIPSFLGNCLGL